MPLYMLVKVDYGHKTNIGLFDTQEKAKAYESSLVMEMFDSSNLCGVSFYVEEMEVQ